MYPRLRVTALKLFFIPVRTRLPLKFGTETLTSVTCCRVFLRVADEQNRTAEGWGETPLSVQWVWPSALPYETRHQALQGFCRELTTRWRGALLDGHPLEAGYQFQEELLPSCFTDFNRRGDPPSAGSASTQTGRLAEPMPWLAALVCNSAFDLALHDAFGRLVGRSIYDTYGPDFIRTDLARFLEPARASSVSFQGRFPADYLVNPAPRRLLAWHLVGGLDPLVAEDLTGPAVADGHPVLLGDWIRRDGLICLKVKLRGNDEEWDYQRLCRVGALALPLGVQHLSADFNCTVGDPAYVNRVLDRLRADEPGLFGRLLYVEQPFPYDLEQHPLEVHSVSSRKPLFLDESAHDWRLVRLGRQLGWTGVALKTCKTQSGAILSACWARAHGLDLMVQDLTNPMLAQIPHLLLAAHVGTIMGVETNSMQFYPEASRPEAAIHPGLYQRCSGRVNLDSIRGPGFGYRLDEIRRALPEPELEV
jgi:L-alanine-DL-glutamate epimerase-like enolase superfamily enzyme